MEYAYPDNLKARPTLWLWELRHIAFIGAGLLLSVLAVRAAGDTGSFRGIGCVCVCHHPHGGDDDPELPLFLCSLFLIGQQLFFWR